MNRGGVCLTMTEGQDNLFLIKGWGEGHLHEGVGGGAPA